MKIYIIHGLAEADINKKISEIKKDFDPFSIFELKGKIIKDIFSEVSTPSLFSSSRLFIIDDLNEDINFKQLPENENLTLIFRFSKTLHPKSKLLNLKLGNSQVLYFPEEKETSIFPFLDGVLIKNPKTLEKLDELLQKFGGQYILTMLFYSLRRLVLPLNFKNEFLRKKVENLKKNFPQNRLKNLYLEILDTDNKIKQGYLSEDLAVKGLILRMIKS